VPLSTIFQLYQLVISLIGEGNRSTRRKLPTCCKSLTNFNQSGKQRFESKIRVRIMLLINIYLWIWKILYSSNYMYIMLILKFKRFRFRILVLSATFNNVLVIFKLNSFNCWGKVTFSATLHLTICSINFVNLSV
jgi:hypothetical protein